LRPAHVRAGRGVRRSERGSRGLRPDPPRGARRPGRGGRGHHPDRRAVTRDPPRRACRLLGPLQRSHRADRRQGTPRRPPLLRQLPRTATREADVPARPRGDAGLPRGRARARVREPGDGRGRDPGRDRGRRPPCRRRRDRCQELVDRDRGRCRRAGGCRARRRRLHGRPDAGPRLRLQPDPARPGAREAPGAGRRSRPGARSNGRRWTMNRQLDGHAITMLGTGLIGEFYTNTLQRQRGRDQVRVVYSRSAERAAAFKDRWGIAEATTDLRAAIAHPDTDVVVIGLPNFLHEEAVELVAKAGKAVLLTKPLGRTAEEARRMLAVVEEADVFAGYLEDLCYTPKTLKAIASVRGGAVGDVTWVRSRETHPGPHSAWFWDGRLTGGGGIIDLSCHCIEIIRNFVGKGNRPVEVMCTTDTLVHPIDDEDNAIALIRFESGAIGQFEVSWTFRGGMDLRDEVAGTHGTIWLNHFLRT